MAERFTAAQHQGESALGRRFVRSVIASTLAAALLANTPDPAAAKITKGERLAQNVPQLAKSDRNFVAKRAARIEALGCSATTLNVGSVATAAHCLDPEQQVQAADGSWYYIAQQPLKVETGRLINKMKSHGVIKSLLVPAVGNTDTDVAIGSYTRSPAAGLSSFRRQQVPRTQLRRLLQPGRDTVVIAGYPQEQPKNFGWLSRQIFQGTALNIDKGVGASLSPQEETPLRLDTLTATFEPTPHGAIPSHGTSGAVAISSRTNKLIGTAFGITVGGEPWQGSKVSGPVGSRQANLNIAHNTSGLDHANGARVLQVVSSADQIPR